MSVYDPASRDNRSVSFCKPKMDRRETSYGGTTRAMKSCVLTINGGSSSIRFAVYEAGETPLPPARGKIDRIGLSGTTLVADDSGEPPPAPLRLAAADHRTAVGVLLDWLEAQPVFASVGAVGHRVVHGMTHAEPERVTPKLLAELRRITPYDPEHLPREIELIEAFQRRHPRLPQVACFDTAFHRTMPRVAKLLPIPRRYEAKGVGATASTACRTRI